MSVRENLMDPSTRESPSSRSRGLRGVPARGLRLLRIRDFWDKALQVLGCAWLYGDPSGRGPASGGTFALYGAAVLFLLMGGYAANDLADYAQDRRSGKDRNRFLPDRRSSLISSVAALSSGLLLIAAASRRSAPMILALLTIVLGIEYSLPPLRLKERGFSGIVAGALTQRPALFCVFAVMAPGWKPLGWALAAWLFFGGLTAMLGHQILDRNYDRSGGVRTYVARRGTARAQGLAAASALAAGLAALSPLLFLEGRGARRISAFLILMSLIYVAKGFRAVRHHKIGGMDQNPSPRANPY